MSRPFNITKYLSKYSSTSNIATTTPSSSTTPSTNNTTNNNSNLNISDAKYNELLAKFNDYITHQDLNKAISNIKPCNCENNQQSTGNITSLEALIQKLNNYGIFKYDTQGKEVIVTEFYPQALPKDPNANDFTAFSLPISADWDFCIIALQNEGYNYNYNDFIYIDINGVKTKVSESAYASYFVNKTILPSIVKTPIVTKTKNGYSLKYYLNHTELINVLTAKNLYNNNISIAGGEQTGYAEFISQESGIETRNNIQCKFNGKSLLSHGLFGTITLTLPETVTVVNTIASPDYCTITVNNNIITYTTGSYDVISAGVEEGMKYQIIIADSATKRYVIKLNCITTEYPSGY